MLLHSVHSDKTLPLSCIFSELRCTQLYHLCGHRCEEAQIVAEGEGFRDQAGRRCVDIEKR